MTLAHIPGVGPNRMRKLIAHFGTPEGVLSASPSELKATRSLDEKTAQNFAAGIDNSFAGRQLSLMEKHGVRLISFWDEDYPSLLKTIYDPPTLLFVRGETELLNGNCLAVVGMRASSQYGQWAAKHFSSELSRRSVTVVSGLARGIDTQAHWGGLSGPGSTVAVLGCGVDIVYPPENNKLYAAVAERGALISEFPLGTEPMAGYFPRRNRIISGLSLGTLVVEAGEKSGALITAYMALDQGREVFAVPGEIRSVKTRGCHRLIKQGAILVENCEDILAGLRLTLPSPEGRSVQPERPTLVEKEEDLLTGLATEPIHVDELATGSSSTTSEVLALLLSLELKGYVRQLPGKMFVRV